ncbi:MLO-like protein 2 isoform X1 [Lotus japonicus]|uniref:MLO-like protein 2 isoform X1 n=1 Tax=Lotus japonicus TaxID=34305 RepID=UPI002584DC15|nr:MLO-like protein 2 isoform X1 [Lotus japonicus]
MDKVAQKKLEETPTWAVAVVCFVMLAISIIIEHGIEAIEKWLEKRHKKALHEAVEKIKGELMLMGFISFLLTVFKDPISNICISKQVASTWHPCHPEEKKKGPEGYYDKCAKDGKDKVAFMSQYGIHQLHIFIFVLAIFHILQCITTLALGRTRMAMWKKWEEETKTLEHQFDNDPERFRFARDTTFGRRHLNSWSQSPISLWIVSFFRQFYGSVDKVDYMVLRHGFIIAHLAPGSESKFDFQKYISRSVDADFKVVVGISPTVWFFAVLILLTNTHGWHSYLWLPFIPLIIILLVGTKLQMIITNMGLKIQERGDVIKGAPLVEPGDDLFWFNRPRLILSLIHLVLFQNAFQLAFFAWSACDNDFKINSCFHRSTADVVIRLTLGVVTQVLCSYVTLPLYALVTQMGSTMRPTIFHDRVATALKSWHHTAKKHVKHNRDSNSHSNTPFSSRPATPTHGMSPVHLLHKHHNYHNSDSPLASPRESPSNYETEQWYLEPNSPSNHTRGHDQTLQMRVKCN